MNPVRPRGTARHPDTAVSSFWIFISSISGIGYFPIASATAATLIQASIVFVFFEEFSLYEIPFLVLLLIVAVKSSSEAEKILGHDAQEIVIDEVCGFMVTVLFLDRMSLSVILTAFFLFRFFDILKPWPVKRSQHLPRGYGIVIDDVLAGIYANLILRLLSGLDVIS
jgi:phosphatidylglycerophosphatase A